MDVNDINGLVEALKYADKVVGTAEGSIQILYDAISGMEYYGSASVPLTPRTYIDATVVKVSNFNADDFLSYKPSLFTGYFYAKGEPLPDSVEYRYPEAGDKQLLHRKNLEEISAGLPNEIRMASTVSYDANLTFDRATDGEYCVYPMSFYDSIFIKNGDSISIDAQWSMDISIGDTIIHKDPGSSVLYIENAKVSGVNSFASVTAENFSKGIDQFLSEFIGEDRKTDTILNIDPSNSEKTNVTTVRKILSQRTMKKAGDVVSIKVNHGKTLSDAIQAVDQFISASKGDASYGGDDFALTENDARKLAGYIFEKFTGMRLY